jgi:hypothetical protein
MLEKFTNHTGRQSIKTLDRYFTSHPISLRFLFRRLVIHDSLNTTRITGIGRY